MAVSKIWAVRGNLGGVLEYAKNKEKTDASLFSEQQYQALEDVLQYAANEEKTEHRFYVEGINCNPATARQQFITVKKQFNKDDGIQAWHGYLSFDQNEVTPKQAQKIGMEFVQKVWGDRFQAVVTTHLNTKHLHCHYVVNSVSFVDGLKMHDEEKAWIHFSRIADQICREHGLSTIEKPRRNPPNQYVTMKEKAGIPTRQSIIRQAVDKALASSRSLEEFAAYMGDMGYEYNLSRNRQYWTVTAPGWKRPMRLYRLGDDYTNERILARIKENAKSPFKVVAYIPIPTRGTYHVPNRGDLLLRRTKLYRKYLYYCYRLGCFPKYQKRKEPLSIPPAMRDDLIKLDRLSAEARLLSREKIGTIQELIMLKERLMEEKAELVEERRTVSNDRRRHLPAKEMDALDRKQTDLSERIRSLKEEIFLCDDILKRSEDLEKKIDMTVSVEGKEKKRHERER
ncbi:MAG: relaxase/mobilization nuclease domain-containing protein [Firmicutes bacterium]|nr:relaxase/mobilization nuclease domain-containing protein [Bacillota bacterium]